MSTENTTSVTAEDRPQIDVNAIKAALHEGTVYIKFTKADGTIREGNFTLKLDKIPAEHHPKPPAEGKPERKPSTTSTRCFDLGIQDWRAFTNANVLEWHPVSE